MLSLRGAPSHSDFRLAKLERRLYAALGRTVSLYAEYMHFAELDQTLTEEEQGILEALLEYGPRLQRRDPSGTLLLVTPRPGTLSPWSTKATDIAHNCGLTKIRRLERGIAYYLDPGDIQEALTAANAIGDDAIQGRMRGKVVPHTFTHGTSEQRMRWFTRGQQTGQMEEGNTFDIPYESL